MGSIIEIRDEETAKMAIRASLTGHLVLSTIHTNSSRETLNRLVDMGIPEYLVRSTLILSVSQRLFRVLCSNCKVAEEEDEKLRHNAHFNDVTYKPVGCEKCLYTGYSGRRAIFEVFQLNEDSTIKNLKFYAFEMYLSGETSYEEIKMYLY